MRGVMPEIGWRKRMRGHRAGRSVRRIAVICSLATARAPKGLIWVNRRGLRHRYCGSKGGETDNDKGFCVACDHHGAAAAAE